MRTPVEMVRNKPMAPSASRRSASLRKRPRSFVGASPRLKLWVRIAATTSAVSAGEKPWRGKSSAAARADNSLADARSGEFFGEIQRKPRRHRRKVRRFMRPPYLKNIFFLLDGAGRMLDGARRSRRAGAIGRGRAELYAGIAVCFVVVA